MTKARILRLEIQSCPSCPMRAEDVSTNHIYCALTNKWIFPEDTTQGGKFPYTCPLKPKEGS